MHLQDLPEILGVFEPLGLTSVLMVALMVAHPCVLGLAAINTPGPAQKDEP